MIFPGNAIHLSHGMHRKTDWTVRFQTNVQPYNIKSIFWITDNGDSIKTECLIIKTMGPPRESLDQSTNVWWFTNNSSVQRSVLHIRERKHTMERVRPGWLESSARPGSQPPQLWRCSHTLHHMGPAAVLLLCILGNVLSSGYAALLSSQGQSSGLNCFMFSRRVIKHSREDFLLRHSWPFWNGAPVSINIDKNHIISVIHHWHTDPR